MEMERDPEKGTMGLGVRNGRESETTSSKALPNGAVDEMDHEMGAKETRMPSVLLSPFPCISTVPQ